MSETEISPAQGMGLKIRSFISELNRLQDMTCNEFRDAVGDLENDEIEKARLDAIYLSQMFDYELNDMRDQSTLSQDL